MPHFLYILQCSDSTYYTGVSQHPEERESAHNTIGAKCTRERRPVRLVYSEAHPDPSSARERENQVKRWSHEKKRALVEGRLGEAAYAPDPVAPDPEILTKLANWRMPFGKYKGRYLIDLPEPYVVWFSRKGYPSGELGLLLQNLYEIKVNGLEKLVERFRH